LQTWFRLTSSCSLLNGRCSETNLALLMIWEVQRYYRN
jgi:hypothetical protein